LINNKINKKNY